LRLAPGGHLGRLIIWTRSAFEQLDKLWGTLKTPSLLKKGYTLPHPILANPDIDRLLRSDEIRSVLRPIRTIAKRKKWVNPFNNPKRMAKLNPYAALARKTTPSRQKKEHAIAEKYRKFTAAQYKARTAKVIQKNKELRAKFKEQKAKVESGEVKLLRGQKGPQRKRISLDRFRDLLHAK